MFTEGFLYIGKQQALSLDIWQCYSVLMCVDNGSRSWKFNAFNAVKHLSALFQGRFQNYTWLRGLNAWWLPIVLAVYKQTETLQLFSFRGECQNIIWFMSSCTVQSLSYLFVSPQTHLFYILDHSSSIVFTNSKIIILRDECKRVLSAYLFNSN